MYSFSKRRIPSKSIITPMDIFPISKQTKKKTGVVASGKHQMQIISCGVLDIVNS